MDLSESNPSNIRPSDSSQSHANKEVFEKSKTHDVTKGSGLTTAELKKKAKEEKLARRARIVKEKHSGLVDTQVPQLSGGQQSKSEGQSGIKSQNKRVTLTENKVNQARGLPKKNLSVPEAPILEDKTVELFRHLYRPRVTTIAGANKETHPAVLALGLQMSNYAICGSCARLVALLHAMKRVITSYTTPPMNSLTRHFPSSVLSTQIDYLSSCRPISISIGNAISWLKRIIAQIDPITSDADAKKLLCNSIDAFIQTRVTFADQAISDSIVKLIRDGDVIMTFAKSSVVQKALIQAFQVGKVFSVIVVDSRPLHEGKSLAAALVRLGISTKYCLLNGLSHNIRDATKVLLGAHAMMGNGRLFSRAGTAIVAMEANDADKPVIVLCETIKLTDKVALDSIVRNEVTPADELVTQGGILQGWQDISKLQLCNLMYDVTPAEYIQMIVTELGNVPPTSVPVLYRLVNEYQD